MRVTVLQENLTKGLNLVSRCIAAKSTLPVLSNLLLSTSEGKLKLSSTNLEVGINLWLGAKIEEEGSLTVPAKILNEFVSSLPADKIDIVSKEMTLMINSGSFKASFVGMAANEFPQIPSFINNSILIFEKEEFVKSLNKVIFAAAQDDGRPVLTGVLIKKEENELYFVATDGYRLSVKKVNVKENKLEGNLLIPAKTLLEIIHILQEKTEEKEVKIALTEEKSQVLFGLPNLEFSSRLLEGNFPDFKKIIPKESTTRVEFDREEFLRTVKIASIFAREQANIVKLKVEEGKLKVMAETPQVGGNESEISVKSEGENLEIAFNCRFLLDFLNSPIGDELVFEASGPLSPGVFKTKGDDSFLHIIMPVKVQEG